MDSRGGDGNKAKATAKVKAKVGSSVVDKKGGGKRRKTDGGGSERELEEDGEVVPGGGTRDGKGDEFWEVGFLFLLLLLLLSVFPSLSVLGLFRWGFPNGNTIPSHLSQNFTLIFSLFPSKYQIYTPHPIPSLPLFGPLEQGQTNNFHPFSSPSIHPPYQIQIQIQKKNRSRCKLC